MLARTPHELILGDRSEVVNGVVVVSYKNHTPTHKIPCQITPDTQGRAFTDFGVESSNPHMMLFNIEFYDVVKKGCVGLHGDRQFFVNVDPKLWDAEPSTACCEVVLEEQHV